MQLVEFYGLMGLAVLLFFLLDILAMKMEVGYYPFHRGVIGTYGLYTTIRIIILAGVYYIVVNNPLIFGVQLPEALNPQWNIIVAITIPFTYLVLFKMIGGYVIRGVNIAAPIEGYLLKIRVEVKNYGHSATLKKLYTKYKKKNPQNPLSGIQRCFCDNMIAMLNMQMPECLEAFNESRNATLRIGGASSLTQADQDKVIISGWLGRIHRFARDKKIEDDVDESILLICSK